MSITDRGLFITVAEAATMLEMSKGRLYRAIKKNASPVPPVQLAGRMGFRRLDVESFLAGITTPPAEHDG